MEAKLTKVCVKVTSNDIHRANSDPSRCPVTRAISRTLREDLQDVDVETSKVYIWDEWDNPCEIYLFEDEDVRDYICGWEGKNPSLPFEFNMIKRRQACLERH